MPRTYLGVCGVTFYDDDSGYALDDPKNPSFFERYVEWADNARKADRENADTAEQASEDEAA